MHIAHMVVLLGPPPRFFLVFFLGKRSSTSAKYWIEDSWKGLVPPSPPISPEQLFTCFFEERKTLFLDFVRSLLQWNSQQQRSALEAYMHS